MFKIFQLWQLPLASAIIWWGMLIALLACWAAQGHPVYDWMQPTRQKIMYISDISASNLQPIFIACSGAQGLLFVISLCVELYLRSTDRLQKGQANPLGVKISLGIAILFAIVGELGILFVSIFNTRHFHSAHTDLLVVFIVFVGVSALSSIAEYSVLQNDYPGKRHVWVSLVGRVVWFCIELALAIGFAACRNKHPDASAVCEWVISFVYPFYQLIMVWDLWPAYNKKKGHYAQNGKYPLVTDYGYTSQYPNQDTSSNPEMYPPSSKSKDSEAHYATQGTNF